MALSSQNISGLNSRKVNFQVDSKTYQAEGVMSVREEEEEDDRKKEAEWNAEVMKKCFESWFVGEQTGEGATKVSRLFFFSLHLIRVNLTPSDL